MFTAALLFAASLAGQVHVLIFARTDCPLTNRYAPEVRRIAREFAAKPVEFWIVYPDRSETAAAIHKQMADFGFPGKAVRDPEHKLMNKAHVTVVPEAAIFDRDGRLVYHGRIDDRWVDFGKARRVAQKHDLEQAIAAVLGGKPVTEHETRAIGCSLADVD